MKAPRAQRSKNDERLARLSLIAGILIWFVQLNSLNSLTSVACKWDWLSYSIAGIPGVKLVEGLISLVAIGLILLVIYLPWRIWNRFQSQPPLRNPQVLADTEKGSRPLLAFVAMLVNSFFLLFAIATFVPMLALRTCGQV
jgi:hypothetical protein